MESTGNKPMPENPKPNEEVQLNIETVTPETEKEKTAAATVASEDGKDQSLNVEIDKEAQGIAPENDSDTTDDDEESTAENPAAVEDNKGGGEPGDARDEVETVSP